MIDGRELWRQLLRVEEPWSVLGFEPDMVRRCYDISIGLEATKGWFSKAHKATSALEKIWRHVNFGDWDVVVHVMAPNGSNLTGLPWSGPQGLPFTNLLCQEIFALLRDGMTADAIAENLRLPQEELWRFQYSMDSGHWSPPLRPRDRLDGARDEDIPPPSDPVWQALLDGSRDIDIRLLSLKLILTKLRSQLNSDAADDMRLLKAQELCTYFVRNKRSLEYEIAQLLEN